MAPPASAFCIDRMEVTVAQYRQCVSAGRCSTPGAAPECNWPSGVRENHPINCVDWNQARAYCEWAHQHLPSESEWALAARGFESRAHPWGDGAPRDQLCWSGVTRRNSTCVVGSFQNGASQSGALDMVGNVWEWTAPDPPRGGPPTNWGGSWTSDTAANVRADSRLRSSAAFRSRDVGFRCASAAR